MSDDLRTLIATTIYGDGEELGWARSITLADLIIWELGLKREGTNPEQIIGHGYPPMFRYVTEWSTT